mgnify:CR=1 FL=1
MSYNGNTTTFSGGTTAGTYAEMYISSSQTITINAASAWTGMGEWTAGDVSGFTIILGDGPRTSTFSSTSSGSGGITVSSLTHNLAVDDWVTLEGSDDYDGVYKITAATSDDFNVEADDIISNSGNWTRCGGFAQSTATGRHLFVWNISAAAAMGNKDYEFAVFIGNIDNTAVLTEPRSARNYGNTSIGNAGGSLIHDVESGDTILLLMRGTTD